MLIQLDLRLFGFCAISQYYIAFLCLVMDEVIQSEQKILSE